MAGSKVLQNRNLWPVSARLLTAGAQNHRQASGRTLESELAVFCGEDHWTVTVGRGVFAKSHKHLARSARRLVLEATFTV